MAYQHLTLVLASVVRHRTMNPRLRTAPGDRSDDEPAFLRRQAGATSNGPVNKIEEAIGVRTTNPSAELKTHGT